MAQDPLIEEEIEITINKFLQQSCSILCWNKFLYFSHDFGQNPPTKEFATAEKISEIMESRIKNTSEIYKDLSRLRFIVKFIIAQLKTDQFFFMRQRSFEEIIPWVKQFLPAEE